MKLRKYKKKVRKFFIKYNVKFHRDRLTRILYMGTRPSRKLPFNWWRLPY